MNIPVEPIQAIFRNATDRVKQFLPRDLKLPELILLGIVCVMGIVLLVFLCVSGVAAEPKQNANSAAPRGPVIDDEIPLGNFNYYLTDLQGSSSRQTHILEFKISVLVNGRKKDIRDLEDQLKSFEYRIEQLVDQSARQAHVDELADPASKQLRKRIKNKTNQLLGQAIIQDVIFSKFRFFSIPTTY